MCYSILDMGCCVCVSLGHGLCVVNLMMKITMMRVAGKYSESERWAPNVEH